MPLDFLSPESVLQSLLDDSDDEDDILDERKSFKDR